MNIVTWDNGSLTARYLVSKQKLIYASQALGEKGKYYYELHIDELAGAGFGVVSTKERYLRTILYGSNDREQSELCIFDNNTTTLTTDLSPVKGYQLNDTIGICIDIDNAKVIYYCNGEYGSTVTFVNVDLKMALAMLCSTSYSIDGCVVTANFGATPFKYLIPEGYTSYDGNQSSKKYLLKDDEGYKRLIPGASSTETCVPNMTSNTEPEGEVTASSSYSVYYPWTAFTNETLGRKGWEAYDVEKLEQWIQYKFKSPKKIVKYYLGSSIGSQYNPTHWRLEASNDGINYKILHEVPNFDRLTTLNHFYNIHNTTEYLYYRLMCLSGGYYNDGKKGCYVFESIKFFEELIPESMELISTEYPTADQFKEKGMSDIPSYGQLSNFNDLVTYTTNNPSKSLVKFEPKAKTVLSSGDINLTGKILKKVSLIGTDSIKILFSKDSGITWWNKTSNKIPIVSATSTSAHYRGNSPNQVFNGITRDIQDGWYVYGQVYQPKETGHVLILDLGINYCVKTVKFYTEPVSTAIDSTGIKDFEIYGSNDGTTREFLLNGTNPMCDAMVIHSYTYCIPESKAYRYYIFNFKGSYYEDTTVFLNEIELYESPIAIPISDISTQGLTPNQLTAITPEEWKAFMGDANSLRFAYYLPDDTANTDKLELTVDVIGE